jgi:hypothetical protein
MDRGMIRIDHLPIVDGLAELRCLLGVPLGLCSPMRSTTSAAQRHDVVPASIAARFTSPTRSSTSSSRRAASGASISDPEVAACRPWLVAELQRVRPTVLVALGATAAGALFGP